MRTRRSNNTTTSKLNIIKPIIIQAKQISYTRFIRGIKVVVQANSLEEAEIKFNYYK